MRINRKYYRSLRSIFCMNFGQIIIIVYLAMNQLTLQAQAYQTELDQ